MKNLFKLLGNLNRACRRQAKVPLLIIALAAVICFSFVSCKDDDAKDAFKDDDAKDALDGTTWVGTQKGTGNVDLTITLMFNSPNYTMYVAPPSGVAQTQIGTYSVSGNRVTLSNQGTWTISGNTLTSGSNVLTKR